MFSIVWICRLQKYIVYKDGKYIRASCLFSDVQSYLNEDKKVVYK